MAMMTFIWVAFALVNVIFIIGILKDGFRLGKVLTFIIVMGVGMMVMQTVIIRVSEVQTQNNVSNPVFDMMIGQKSAPVQELSPSPTTIKQVYVPTHIEYNITEIDYETEMNDYVKQYDNVHDIDDSLASLKLEDT